MSLCVDLLQDGTIQALSATPEECPGFVLVSGAEFAHLDMFARLFQEPDTEQLITLFGSIVGLVVFFFVLGRLVGTLANFFNR